MKDNPKRQQPQAVKLSFRYINAFLQPFLLNNKEINQNKTKTNMSF